MNLRDLLLPIVTVALLAANVIVLAIYGEYVSRIMRFFSMVAFFFLFLRSKYYKSSALIIFSAFVLNDLLLIFFETVMSQNLVLFIRLCAYILLAKLVLPYLRKIKIKLFEGLLFATILLMNVWLLYSIQDSINAVSNGGWLGEFLVYGYGTAAILSVIAAFAFYSRYVDKTSIFFLLAVIGLVMSDLTYFIGFYLDFPEFYYLDRSFNIVAIGFLLHFLFLFKKKIARGFYDMAGENL